MPAKLINMSSDENPDLPEQMGCMTGFFHMFDRQQLFNGRRLNGLGLKRIPSVGHAPLNSRSKETEQNVCPPQILLEKNLSKGLRENRTVSMEPSRASFSSSSSSSFSSFECSKSTQQEVSSFDRTFFQERPLKSSLKFKSSEDAAHHICSEPDNDSPVVSTQSGQQFRDFRNVVKDSMQRDTQGFTIKTQIREQVAKVAEKHKDSPRPALHSNPEDGINVAESNGKSRMPVDLNESVRVLMKLKEAPWTYTKYEAKDASLYSPSTLTPRLSCDGREFSCQSMDSQDNKKSAAKLGQLPRLSLDSRQGSPRNSNFLSIANSLLEDSDGISRVQRFSKTLNLDQDHHKRSPNVVAKLMGLGELPGMGLAVKLTKAVPDTRHDQCIRAPKSSYRESTLTKPINPGTSLKKNSRIITETAPWMQQDRAGVTRKTKQQPVSAYGEIEEKLNELDFQQSNKDLRALKQVLDMIHAKGFLERNRNSEQQSKSSRLESNREQSRIGKYQNLILQNAQKQVSSSSGTSRALKPPIVIMKPAKSVNRSGASIGPGTTLEGLSGLRKLHTGSSDDRKKASPGSKNEKDRSPKVGHKEFNVQVPITTDKQLKKQFAENRVQKSLSHTAQGLSNPQYHLRESSGSPKKVSSSLSPRLQQRKVEAEKKSYPPIPSLDINNAKRQSSNRQPVESISPRSKLRLKQSQVQKDDDQVDTIISYKKIIDCKDGKISQRPVRNISLASHADVEQISTKKFIDMKYTILLQGIQSPLNEVASSGSLMMDQKGCIQILDEHISNEELSNIANEQPSPVSVLDASLYQDVFPHSPVKQASNALQDVQTHSLDMRCYPTGLSDSQPSELGAKTKLKKLEDVENIDQKLKKLHSDYHVPTERNTLKHKMQSPDYKYVSEILVATGFLHKDLTVEPMFSVPFQLHSSGYPINPDLFFVLEQPKHDWPSILEPLQKCDVQQKPNPEKLHRKLVFDAVNEILSHKIELHAYGNCIGFSLQGRRLSEQQLQEDICSEIERLQAESIRSSSLDDDANYIFSRDVFHQSEGWADYSTARAGLVVEIERLILKELIDEVVNG